MPDQSQDDAAPPTHNRAPRLQSVEAWWAVVFRVLSGLAGLTILVGQAFEIANYQLALTVAGIGLCGPIAAAAAGSFIETMRGSK